MPTRSSAIIGVVALAVGLAVSAPFVNSPAGSGPRGSEPAGLAAVAPAPDWISLVTGDQVAIDASGTLLAVRPATGREGIRMSVYRSDGHLYVVPADAAAFVGNGVVDRRLFDVTLLARPEYRRQNQDGLAVIVTYNGPGARSVVRSVPGIRVDHAYTSINGDGLRLGKRGSADAWQRLTLTTGIKRVWLDVVQDSLYS